MERPFPRRAGWASDGAISEGILSLVGVDEPSAASFSGKRRAVGAAGDGLQPGCEARVRGRGWCPRRRA
jgi:hypothetical protein